MSLESLVDAVHTQRNHFAGLDGFALDFVTGGALDHEVTHGFVRHEELVNTATALETRTIALGAALSVIELHVRREVKFVAEFLRDFDGLLAVLAYAAHKSLGQDALDSGRDKERFQSDRKSVV